MARHYRVVLLNRFNADTDVEAIKTAFAKQFKLDRDAVEKLFAQEMVTVKKDLDAETAANYKMAIDRTGANSRIEMMLDDTQFAERRESDERRKLGDRRKQARTNSILPDRRVHKDRRGE